MINIGWCKFPEIEPESEGVYSTDLGCLCWDSADRIWLEICEYGPWEPVSKSPTRFYEVPEYKEMNSGKD